MALRALHERLPELSLHDNRYAYVESTGKRWPMCQLRLPRRYLTHLGLCISVALIVASDGGRSWHAVPSQGLSLVNDEPKGVSLAIPDELFRPLAPVDTFVEVKESAQIAPMHRLPDSAASPFFSRYTVAHGDTVQQIALAHGITIDSVVWANELQEGAILAVGSELRLPRLAGVPHIVATGETVASIARSYDVATDSIIALPENALQLQNESIIGTELFIPGAHPAPGARFLERYGSVEAFATRPAHLVGRIRESQTNLRSGPSRVYPRMTYLDKDVAVVPVALHGDWIKVETADTDGWVAADLAAWPIGLLDTLVETNDIPPPPLRWVWPARGTITSPFGQRWGALHNGIDIANRAWTPIVAARAGRVFEAGWCRGFGYCVKITHDGGIQTIYGHLVARPVVSVGEDVTVGQHIGSMGSTYDASGGGYSTGVHLHFTVKVGGRAVDPLKYLP